MILSIIAAMDERRGIGIDNRLPWRLSSDLRRFRELTMGHHILMGRKTFESIGKPLPGRETIIVTRNYGYRVEGCLTAHSVEEGIAAARASKETELFVCGGAEIFAQTIGMADRMYLTCVHATVAADTFFPEYDAARWEEVQTAYQEADEKNQYASTFRLLKRI